MAKTPSPASVAKNLIAIHKGDAKRATEGVRSCRDSADPYWAAVLDAIATAEGKA